MRKLLAFALGLVLAAAPAAAQQSKPPLDWAALALPALEGGTHSAALFQGKVVLVVNTASMCGFTGQYEDLQALWQRYKGRDFVVLGVPSNDFGGQEPGSSAQIKSFCQLNYGVDFPLLEKQVVTGSGAHPLYRWAAAATGPAGVPRWNFHKLLIGRDGRLVTWFATPVKPTDPEVLKRVDAALATPTH